MLLEKRKNRLLIEWSQVRVLLGEPDLCFGRIVSCYARGDDFGQ